MRLRRLFVAAFSSTCFSLLLVTLVMEAGSREEGGSMWTMNVGSSHPRSVLQLRDEEEVEVHGSVAQVGSERAAEDVRAENKVYWGKEVDEGNEEEGLSDEDVREFASKVRGGRVASLRAPTWNECGRPKNQLLTLIGGTKACGRYRRPHDYLVKGEVLSFYLARLLGIQNVPSVVLAKVSSHGKQWSFPGVQHAVRRAKWTNGSFVAFIQWVDDLERDKMPAILLEALSHGTTITHNHTTTLTHRQQVNLMQWSDLTIFDYVTGNYDRVASMQDAADKEKKPAILRQNIHNLVRHKHTGALWMIDNESGLLDAYSLMYNQLYQKNGARFLHFHRRMLRTSCMFRQSTVRRIKSLFERERPHQVLVDYAGKEEPLLQEVIIEDMLMMSLFRKNFRSRLKDVLDWVEECTRSTVHV